MMGNGYSYNEGDVIRDEEDTVESDCNDEQVPSHSPGGRLANQ